MAVLRFFKMADVRHLGFVQVRKFEILNASRVQRANVYHHVIFRASRSS